MNLDVVEVFRIILKLDQIDYIVAKQEIQNWKNLNWISYLHEYIETEKNEEQQAVMNAFWVNFHVTWKS